MLKSGFDFQNQTDALTTKLSDKKSLLFTSSKIKESIHEKEKSATINRSVFLNKI